VQRLSDIGSRTICIQCVGMSTVVWTNVYGHVQHVNKRIDSFFTLKYRRLFYTSMVAQEAERAGKGQEKSVIVSYRVSLLE
jgi:hypothetical protein